MSRSTADVGRALGLLGEGLGPFVEREVGRLATRNQIEDFIGSNSHSNPKLRRTRIREWEAAVLLNLMQRLLWGDVFAHTLEPTERGYVNELRGWRNKWAHQESLTAADVDRALDTTVRLLRAVEAETQAAEVARLRSRAELPTRPRVLRGCRKRTKFVGMRLRTTLRRGANWAKKRLPSALATSSAKWGCAKPRPMFAAPWKAASSKLKPVSYS